MVGFSLSTKVIDLGECSRKVGLTTQDFPTFVDKLVLANWPMELRVVTCPKRSEVGDARCYLLLVAYAYTFAYVKGCYLTVLLSPDDT